MKGRDMSTQSAFAKYVASGSANRAANAAVQAAVARQIAAGLIVNGTPITTKKPLKERPKGCGA